MILAIPNLSKQLFGPFACSFGVGRRLAAGAAPPSVANVRPIQTTTQQPAFFQALPAPPRSSPGASIPPLQNPFSPPSNLFSTGRRRRTKKRKDKSKRHSRENRKTKKQKQKKSKKKAAQESKRSTPNSTSGPKDNTRQ